MPCFMAGLWNVLWPNWGLFWDYFVALIRIVLGLFCALFYGLFVACHMAIWACFVDTLCVILGFED